MDVLLVEDVPEMSALLQATLESRGHTVTTVADGESGWKSYQTQDFPMVILDWLLPGMDGLEVCRRIRRIPKGADSLILMITAHSNPGDLERILAAGADDYLAKPVDAHLLNIRLTIAEQRVIKLKHQSEAEAARVVANATCTQTQTMLQQVLDTIPARVFWKDRDSRYLGCNHLFAVDAGLQDRSQIVGKTDHDLCWAAQAPLYISDDRAVMQSGLPKLHYEEMATTPDGDLVYLETSKIPLTDGAGNLIGVLGTYRDITERKKNEAELRIAATAFESQESLMITDTYGEILRVNHAFTEITGYTAEEIVGQTPRLLQSGHHDADFYRAMWETINLTGTWQGEIWDRRKNGEIYPQWLTITAVKGNNGAVTHYVSSHIDITEHKKIEKERMFEHESERRRSIILAQQFGKLLKSSYNEIYLFDAYSMHFLQVSEGAKKNLGYSDDELRKFTPSHLMPSFTQQSFGELIAPLRSGEQQMLILETFHRRRDSTIYPVEMRLQLMETEHPVFMSVIQDLTERKRASTALEKSEHHLKQAQSMAHIGSWDVDLAAARIKWSDELYRIYGVSPETFSPNREAFINLIYPVDQPAMRAWINACASGQKPGAVEFRCIWPDGTIRFIYGQGELIFDAEGKPSHMAGTAQDITERKRSELQLRDLSSHLQTVREEEKASIAREVHDNLGSTLTALKMDVYWLAEELSAHKEATPLLEHVESMSQLLDNAVEVTRRIITDLRPTILDDLGLQAALEWQAGQFHKRTGIQCRVTCLEDEGHKGELNKIQTINLFRIFQESLTNVARHSGASRVKVELQYKVKEIILVISDNGCGLPEGHTISRTSYGMLGMRERVEQLDGRINFYSPPGGGFSVTVMLPLIIVNSEEEET